MFLTGIDTFQVLSSTQPSATSRKPVSAIRPGDEDAQRSKGSQEQVPGIQDPVTLSKEAQALSASLHPSQPSGSLSEPATHFDR